MQNKNNVFGFTPKKQGISLIVLVITILVMIVIAGVTILVLNQTGVIDRARESNFKSAMKSYIETLNVYLADKMVSSGSVDLNTINVAVSTTGENPDLKNIIKNVKNDHIKYLSIEKGVLLFNISDSASEEDIKYAYYACQVGMKVKNFNTCSDVYNANKKPYLTGKFVDGISTPDLTGFNIAKTRYVYYSSTGEEIIGDTIDNKPPENWYNYSDSTTPGNNKWANIVVENEYNVAYFTWIPRYEYKVENNVTTINYISRETINSSTGYKIPESFIWDMTDDGGTVKQLSGIWVSKYKVSENGNANVNISYKVNENKISTSVQTTTGGTLKYVYLISELGKTPIKKAETTNNSYEFTSLKEGTTYSIIAKVYTADGSNIIGSSTKKVYIAKTESPDITGFNVSKSRYVSYDASGKEIVGNILSEQKPSSWYDYNNNKWANIRIESNQNIAYFTWVPRYEYKTYKYNGTLFTDINYIEKTKDTPTEGYKIPESFTWDMTDDGGVKLPLSGFWVSKYKVNENNKFYIDFTYKVNLTYIDVTDIITTNSISTGTMLYEYYISEFGSKPIKITENNTGIYTFLGLTSGKTYDVLIKLYNIDASGNVIKYIGNCEKYIYINAPSVPDLTGFNTSKTKYITYDSSDAEVEGNLINSSMPLSWYDYNNNKWANIKVENGSNVAYFTWIPRYEYRTYNYNGTIKTDISYIPSSKSTPSAGYKIPESFTWNMTDSGANIKQLSGFWMSKYKVSQNT